MKKLIYIILVIIISCSCNKNKTGEVLYNINFTTTEIQSMNKRSYSEPLYTQFGSYITSLTPYKLTARIWTVGYIDKVLDRTNNSANMLQYIEQNSEKLSFNDSSRYVDFSNNNIVSFDPVIYGRVNNDSQFEDRQIDFRYFYFIPINLYQEVQLPDQYQNIHINMFPAYNTVGNILKINHYEMLREVFPKANVTNNLYFIFGNSDSTFVVNKNGESVGFSENCPIAEPGTSLVIRSEKYSNMIFNTPPEGETVIMNGVLSFNTQNLIQVYAGADNIPFTGDDIFVYAPKFWERINSRLDIN
jgi:hypothetical protein